MHSIAFPAISTGIYGYSIKEVALIAIKAVKKWFEQNSMYAMIISFDEMTDREFKKAKVLLQAASD